MLASRPTRESLQPIRFSISTLKHNTYERQENLQTIADFYFNVETNNQESLRTTADPYFNVEINIHNISQAGQHNI